MHPNPCHPECLPLARRTLCLFLPKLELPPMRTRRYYVYMLQSISRHALYTGMTNSAYRRKDEHDAADDSTFAGRYKTHRLVYLELFEDVRNAIDREKEIKGWTRAKKEVLVRSVNPQWRDLSADWKDRFKPKKQPQGPSGRETGPQDDKPKK